MLDQLDGRPDSERIAALWELARCGQPTWAAVQAVAGCLDDRQPAIRDEAARALAQWGPAAEAAVHVWPVHWRNSAEEVRTAAAFALGKLRLKADFVVPRLAERLDDPPAVGAVAWALTQFAGAARSALPALLARLKGELERGDGPIEHLASAIARFRPSRRLR